MFSKIIVLFIVLQVTWLSEGRSKLMEKSNYDDAEDLKKELVKEVDQLYNATSKLCPTLIEHPALRGDCFDLWIKIDNIIIEFNKSLKYQELRLIEKIVDTFTDKIDEIK